MAAKPRPRIATSQTDPIMTMAIGFKAVTDTFFASTGPEDPAAELGCAAQSIGQARMAQNAGGTGLPRRLGGRRSPPGAPESRPASNTG